MSVTIPAFFRNYCLTKENSFLLVIFVLEKDLQYAPTPLGKPYYFWDKELSFLEEKLPIQLTFKLKQGKSIIKKDGNLMQTKFFIGNRERWMYVSFNDKQYADIVRKSCKKNDEIKVEFSYRIKRNLQVLKHYYPNSDNENKKTMLPAKYCLNDAPGNYSFAWKMLQTFLMKTSSVDCDDCVQHLVLKASMTNIKKLAQPIGKEYYFWDRDMVKEKESIYSTPLCVTLSFHFQTNNIDCDKCYLNEKPCEDAVTTTGFLQHIMHSDQDDVLIYVSFKNKDFYQHLAGREIDSDCKIDSDSKIDSDNKTNCIMLSFEKEPNIKVEKIYLLD